MFFFYVALFPWFSLCKKASGLHQSIGYSVFFFLFFLLHFFISFLNIINLFLTSTTLDGPFISVHMCIDGGVEQLPLT